MMRTSLARRLGRSLGWVALGLVALNANAEPNYASSWEKAKRSVKAVYADNRVDQYCGCTFDRRNRVDLGSCAYKVRKDGRRAMRIEMEHVVPAASLGQQRACWRSGGRKNCEANDPDFIKAHNDLHNIIPAVGEVNGDRSNFRFAELSMPSNQYGACPFKVDFQQRAAEPPPHLKGDIARINFYMRAQHGLRLSQQQERLFQVWDKIDPVDQWEIKRDERIRRIQGNSNPFVTGLTETQVVDNPFTGSADISPQIAGPAIAPPIDTGGFSCSERKSCSAMRSCEEAVYHLQVCGNTRLDGNSDGRPCQAICR
jgi:deoxyribonuclease-1